MRAKCSETKKMKLHLHLKTEYFAQVKTGEKKREYRLANKYWQPRLEGREYDAVIIHNAYKPGEENRLEFPWRGWTKEQRKHKHFGAESVLVYAIILEKP